MVPTLFPLQETNWSPMTPLQGHAKHHPHQATDPKRTPPRRPESQSGPGLALLDTADGEPVPAEETYAAIGESLVAPPPSQTEAFIAEAGYAPSAETVLPPGLSQASAGLGAEATTSSAAPSYWFSQALKQLAAGIETYSGYVFTATAALMQSAAAQDMRTDTSSRAEVPSPAPAPSPSPAPAPSGHSASWVYDLSTQAEQVLVSSTEAGTAYLVKTGGAGALVPASLADILGADDSLWNSLTLSRAKRYEAMSLEGLQEGTYTLYTVDAAGKLSATSNLPLTVSHQGPQAFLTSGTASKQGRALVQSTQKGVAYLVKTQGEGAVVNVSQLEDILAADDALWNAIDITEANRSVGLSLNGLEEGSYQLYTANAAGQLSAASAYSLTVSQTRTAQGFLVTGQKPFESSELFAAGVTVQAFLNDGLSLDEIKDIYYTDEEVNRIVWGVAGAGDVNGDGLDDLIMVPYFQDFMIFNTKEVFVASAYVVFGKQDGGPINLQELSQGRGGFALTPTAFRSVVPAYVAGVGDVNGDGFDDVMLVMPTRSPSARGYLNYVVFGKTDGAEVDLSEIEAGRGGFAVTFTEGEVRSIGRAGDINGDGLADLLIFTASYPKMGPVYVVYGKTDGLPVSLSDISAGRGGFEIYGLNKEFPDDDFNVFTSMSPAGDVNGDGLDDLIIGSPAWGRYDNGQCYVVFGKRNNEAVYLDQVALGVGGFRIYSDQRQVFLGSSASGAGDINGDGLADLVVQSNVGTYIAFGKADGAGVDTAALSQGIGGFKIEGVNYPVASFCGVGDVNGDGLADLVCSVRGTDQAAFVIFGKTDTAPVLLDELSQGIGAYAIMADPNYTKIFYDISAAGDVNGDGLADLIIGTRPGARGVGHLSSPFGPSYVVFGQTGTAAIELSNLTRAQDSAAHLLDYQGSNGNDQWTGSAANEIALGGLGDDALFGRGGADVLLGGAGNDTLVLNVSNVQALYEGGLSAGLLARADGGTGVDTLRLEGASMTLDLSALGKLQYPKGSSRLSSIERIDLSGVGNYTLQGLTLQDVIDMSSPNAFNSTQGWNGLDAMVTRYQWLVDGDAGDRVELAHPSDWVQAGQASHAGSVYDIYNHLSGHAQLLLAQPLTVVM